MSKAEWTTDSPVKIGMYKVRSAVGIKFSKVFEVELKRRFLRRGLFVIIPYPSPLEKRNYGFLKIKDTAGRLEWLGPIDPPA